MALAVLVVVVLVVVVVVPLQHGWVFLLVSLSTTTNTGYHQQSTPKMVHELGHGGCRPHDMVKRLVYGLSGTALVPSIGNLDNH